MACYNGLPTVTVGPVLSDEERRDALDRLRASVEGVVPLPAPKAAPGPNGEQRETDEERMARYRAIADDESEKPSLREAARAQLRPDGRSVSRGYAEFLDVEAPDAGARRPDRARRSRPSAAVPVPAGPRALGVRKGRAALFADTGLGKTFMQLEWARLIGVAHAHRRAAVGGAADRPRGREASASTCTYVRDGKPAGADHASRTTRCSTHFDPADYGPSSSTSPASSRRSTARRGSG